MSVVDNGTQVEPKAEGSQQATPDAQVNANHDNAVELEKIRQEKENLQKQLADKDRFITELSSEKSTLEARLTQTQPRQQQVDVPSDLQSEYVKVLELAQVDPKSAGEQMAVLMSKVTQKAQNDAMQNLEPTMNRQMYVTKVKNENTDLIELGLEPHITLRANSLMSSGKQFNEAIDIAVKEAREKVNKIKQVTPTTPTPPPSGAVVEKGANSNPPPTPPVKEMTDEDEMEEQRKRRRAMGL